MDVLIYLRGIFADLVVADLNPDQPPSLLKNPPDLEMSSKVMLTLRHSSLRLYPLFHSLRIFSALSGTSSLRLSAWRWKTVRVKREFKNTKCPPVYAKASKGKRTSAPIHIDLFSPGDSGAAKICSFWACRRGRRFCRLSLWTLRWGVESAADSFPTGEGRGRESESACLRPRCHWLASLWTCKSHHLYARCY